MIKLVNESNDFAFDLFKNQYLKILNEDPMLLPILIQALAYDWVYKNHKRTEEQFKAALFEHKIYEEPSVAMHMQQKQ